MEFLAYILLCFFIALKFLVDFLAPREDVLKWRVITFCTVAAILSFLHDKGLLLPLMDFIEYKMESNDTHPYKKSPQEALEILTK